MERFEEVNDTLVRYGDSLIKRIAERVQDIVSGNTVARLDGNTFAIILSENGLPNVMDKAQEILSALARPFSIEGLAVYVEGSIGIASYPTHGLQANTIMQRADVAVHLTKMSGKAYAVYSQEKDEHSARRLALMAALFIAIEANQLFLQYQPKLSMQTGRLVGVEALIRWQHPQYGLILPNEFIPPAEQTGLIKPLTDWVLKETFKQCVNWKQKGFEIGIAVNLSARNIEDPNLVPYISTLFSMSGIAPRLLKLEIVESVIMADPERAAQVLVQFSQMGVLSSIDDFGTGYSSLGYLKKLPVSELKIDKSFIKDMLTEEATAQIVHAIIELAHRLIISVVAEGVEDQETYDALKALGCDVVQGYHISRPLSADDLLSWLEKTGVGVAGAG